MLAAGAGRLLKGERPKVKDLLLTPGNIQRITDQLATLRGAAMKIGQLLSMEGGEFLPKPLTDILARLRDDADPMPKSQLQQVLDEEWGAGWNDKLLYFSFAPIAAASIGQVHKAITLDGRMLAVKIQYPGIKQSIDSDVDNVATLLKLSGLVPTGVDLQFFLTEAKAQLHQEADYEYEASMLTAYQAALANDDSFIVPGLADEWSTSTILAMDFITSEPIESLITAPQAVRDDCVTALFSLFFKEVFDFKLIQSDPNLANFRYCEDTKQLVLLDFGACRAIPAELSDGYRRLLNAIADDDALAIAQAAISIGLLSNDHSDAQKDAVVALGQLACEAVYCDGPYDFGNSDLLTRLHHAGMALTMELDFHHIPPVDAVFVHRKLAGLFMIAKKLEASINLPAIIAPWRQ